jgi:hypothetical protein
MVKSLTIRGVIRQGDISRLPLDTGEMLFGERVSSAKLFLTASRKSATRKTLRRHSLRELGNYTVADL